MNRRPAPSFACVVRVRDLTKTFGPPGRETIAVKNVSLAVAPGERVLLLGPSGSGKTTLLTLMAGLLAPTSGSVELFGRDVSTMHPRALQSLRAAAIGFVFQTFRLIDSLTALENVLLVLHFAGRPRAEARRRALVLLDRLGVAHLAGKRPRALSQGEKQRVAVARALANDPPLLVADEPTANLDSACGLEVARLLGEAAAEGRRSLVVTSHDERLARHADRVLRLADGLLYEEGVPRTRRRLHSTP